MMKHIAFAVCCLSCACGCSSHKDEKAELSAKQTDTLLEAQLLRSCRNRIRKLYPPDELFFLIRKGDEPFKPSSAYPYENLLLSVHVPLSRPNTEYFVYCPSTGCPEEPEVALALRSDEGGMLIPQGVFDKWKKNDLKKYLELRTALPANPGYCSDWYLICLNPLSVLHTTFTYKPIISSDDCGRTLTIQKLEAGGNYLEVLLNGFRPKQKVTVVSDYSGKTVQREVETGEDGSYSFALPPIALQETKGVVRITGLYEEGSLQASCEWDRKTLDIKSNRPRSKLWKFLLKFLNTNGKAVAK